MTENKQHTIYSSDKELKNDIKILLDFFISNARIQLGAGVKEMKAHNRLRKFINEGDNNE